MDELLDHPANKLRESMVFLQATLLLHWLGESTPLSMSTMENARARVAHIVGATPGLGGTIKAVVADGWAHSRIIASAGCAGYDIPATCPWRPADMLKAGWLPEQRGSR